MLTLSKLNKYIFGKTGFNVYHTEIVSNKSRLNTLLVGIVKITDNYLGKIILELHHRCYKFELSKDYFINKNYYNITIKCGLRNTGHDFIRITDIYHNNKFERRYIEIEKYTVDKLLPILNID
jgi:hypothetical protein